MNSKHIIQLNGKEYITYPGLLAAAHEAKLKSISVELIQLPTSENDMTAICKASATDEDGNTYSDYGDASPASVNSKIVPHLIRVASTRAKSRTLRDLTNIGMTAFEELNSEEIETTEPATLPQLTLIRKLSSKQNIEVSCENLTKQSASELITKLQSNKTVATEGGAK